MALIVDMPTPRPQREPAPQDWHPADIIAAIRKQRTSLARLSRQRGYAAGSLSVVMSRPWPRAERIIAAAIGVPPQTIWPSRYHVDGTPKKDSSTRHTGARKAA